MQEIIYILIIILIIYFLHKRKSARQSAQHNTLMEKVFMLTNEKDMSLSAQYIDNINSMLKDFRAPYQSKNGPAYDNNRFIQNIKDYINSAEELRLYIGQKFGYPELITTAEIGRPKPNIKVFQMSQVLPILKSQLEK